MSAGKNVFQGVSGVFKKEKDFALPANGHEIPPVPYLPTGQVSQPVGQSEAPAGAAFPAPTTEGGKSVAGTLRLTVMDAKDLPNHDTKPYVTVRVGDKEVKTKHAGKTETPEW